MQGRQELVAQERIVAREPVPLGRRDARQAVHDFDGHERGTRVSGICGMVDGCARLLRAGSMIYEEFAKLNTGASRRVLDSRARVLC